MISWTSFSASKRNPNERSQNSARTRSFRPFPNSSFSRCAFRDLGFHGRFNLRDYLRAFDDPQIDVLDYEEAAELHNRCRARGIAGSAIDFLICAVAQRRDWQVFTTDTDFERYKTALSLKLYRV